MASGSWNTRESGGVARRRLELAEKKKMTLKNQSLELHRSNRQRNGEDEW
jgi:hypothetical protein